MPLPSGWLLAAKLAPVEAAAALPVLSAGYRKKVASLLSLFLIHA